MVVALSIVLGNLRLLELPNGGSIAFGTLPLILLAVVRGFRPAFLAGWCAGLGHALAGGTIIHPAQYLLDYGLAYALLACAAASRGTSRPRLALGALCAGAAHYAVFVASGTVFFAQYANGASPLTYSLVYNAITVVPEVIIAMLVLPTLVRAFARSNPREGYRLGLLPLPLPLPLQRPPRHPGAATAAPHAQLTVTSLPSPDPELAIVRHTTPRSVPSPSTPQPARSLAGRPAPLLTPFSFQPAPS